MSHPIPLHTLFINLSTPSCIYISLYLYLYLYLTLQVQHAPEQRQQPQQASDGEALFVPVDIGNCAKILDHLDVGTPVRIANKVPGNIKDMVGRMGRVYEMPVHRSTWVKIVFIDDAIITFRTSSLIILRSVSLPPDTTGFEPTVAAGAVSILSMCGF